MDLPTLEEIRRQAHKLLGDTQDVLRSDWQPGHGPNTAQADALTQARQHIAAAKDALNAATEEEVNR